MKVYQVGEYRRIQKKTAKRLYENGEVVYLCPCKLRPGGFWRPEIAITKMKIDKLPGENQYFVSLTKDFEQVVAEYQYYNCNTETGRTPFYYIKTS